MRGRIDGSSTKQHATPHAATQATYGSSAIQLAGQSNPRKQWDIPVCHSGPAVGVAIESPILAAIEACRTERQWLAMDCLRPRHSRSISGLAGFFPGLRNAIEAGIGWFAIDVIQHAAG